MFRWIIALQLILNAAMAWAEPSVSCRVFNRLAQFNNVGSGTLVDVTDDGTEGLVLTCAHLFTEGVGQIVVEFPQGKSHGAKLIAIDRGADLAALAISKPDGPRATVNFAVEKNQPVRACGFGPAGAYECATGPVVGEVSDAEQVSMLIGDAVRSGDSGGGVFDSDGNLVAVVWGEAGGVTYASGGAPLRRFLDRVLGRRTAFVYACPGGTCPRPFGGGVANRPVVPSLPASEFIGAGTPDGVPAAMIALNELRERIAALEQSKQDRGDYVTRGELGSFLNGNGNSSPDAVAKRQAGITGLAGWGVVGVTTLGGWLAGRLMRRFGGRRIGRFQE
jgi:S1-C subfamily serine protease